MTILDYIAANPGCSGGEIAAALNTPTTAINAELRRLWRSGSVIRKERKTGGRFSYQINPMPFGCGNPLTNMFNQLLKEARAGAPSTTRNYATWRLTCNEWQRLKNYWRFAQCSRRLLCWRCWMSWSTPEPHLSPFA